MKLKRANSHALHALMYMVRHMTQGPLTVRAIAKAECIPYRQLAGIFRQLSEAGIVETAASEQGGYVFKRSPSEVTLLELFELIEGHPLFDECFMKHSDCPGTPANCVIYESWHQATAKISKKLAEISIDTAAWGHPEHSMQQCCLSIEDVEEH